MQLGPWGNRRRSSPESGEAGGAPGQKGGGEGSRAHSSSISLVGWGGSMAGEGARRRPAAASAAAGNSGEAKAELGNARQGKLLCGPGKAQGGWPATEGSAGWSSTRPCQWRRAERLGVGSACENTWLLFYRRRTRTRATNGLVVHCGWPADEGEHNTWRGDSEMPRCVRVLGETGSLGRRDLGRRPGAQTPRAGAAWRARERRGAGACGVARGRVQP
jgi:hypothetical protein